MNKKFLVIFFICLFIKVAGYTQDIPPSPWVSDKGWWVVESNIHMPKQAIVYFYNNDGVLVYKENVQGLRINPSKATTKMQLKQVLEASVLAWEKKHPIKENEALVADVLRKK